MSITDNIKSGFLKRKKNVAEKRNVVLKNPAVFSKILIVGDKENESLLKSAQSLFPNAEINSLFQRKEKEDKTSKFRFAVHPSDFNLTGHLKNDKLTKLIQTEFDLVLDLSHDSVFLNELTSRIKNTLFVGRMIQDSDSRYDLFFNGESDEEFLNQTVKQLKLLTKNER
ncbi:MAG: hypothetical protein IPM77_09385 [Crocinitomicaceae bacterium]|nr:hypothetical protein [Crocinitomicaceae bacterium]